MSHFGINISYMLRDGNWKVRQLIDTITPYRFEGDLITIFENIKNELDHLKSYIEKPAVLRADYFVDFVPNQSPISFRPNWQDRSVQFDRIELAWETEYDEQVLKVWGYRKALPEEVEALEEEKKHYEAKRSAEEKKQYEALKAKFEK